MISRAHLCAFVGTRFEGLDTPFQREVICPSCQCVAGAIACGVGQITGTFPRVFCPHEGRFAIVTKRWAEDAVDAAAHKTNAHVADGEVVAS